MDSIIAILVLVLFYALQALASRRRKQNPAPDLQETGAQSGLDDALAEIREALGMPDPSPTTPAPTPSSRPAPPPEQLRTSQKMGKPERPWPSEEEFHRVETGRPDFEDAFERQQSGWRPLPTPAPAPAPRPQPVRNLEDEFERLRSEFRDPLRDHDHRDDDDNDAEPPKRRGKSRFGTTDKLQEALIAREVLGRPRALGPHR